MADDKKVITIQVNSASDANNALSEYINDKLPKSNGVTYEIIVDKNNIKIYFGGFYVEIILARYSVRVSFVKASSLIRVSKTGFNYIVTNEIDSTNFNAAIDAYKFIMTDSSFLQGLLNTYIGLSVSLNDKIDTLLRNISKEGADVQGLINEFYGIKPPQNTGQNSNNTSNFTVTVTIDPNGGGTVNGAGTYQKDATVTLTATANEGYSFANWKIDNEAVGTDSTYTFTINNNVNITATFSAQQG